MKGSEAPTRRFKLVNRQGDYVAEGEEREDTYRVFLGDLGLYHEYPESEFDTMLAHFGATGMQYLLCVK